MISNRNRGHGRILISDGASLKITATSPKVGETAAILLDLNAETTRRAIIGPIGEIVWFNDSLGSESSE